MNVARFALDNDDSAVYRPYLNTGGVTDMVNGKYMSATNGGFALSGGLGVTTGIIAEANRYKSTFLNSCSINAMARWPHSRFYINDTESAAIDKHRLASMSTLYLDDSEKRESHIEDIENRITIYDPTTDVGESLESFVDKLKDIRDKKVANYKDWEVEAEIINPETGKPYRMLLPTFASVDSWTEAMVRQLNIKNEEHDADTEMKDQRTIFMDEGWQKARLMRQIPTICAKGGIYLSLTGHLGKKIAIGNTPNKKDIQYMGQDETVKSMGNKFYFLMSSIFKISNTYPLVDKNNKLESEYPGEAHVSGKELQELSITMVRCKNAPSGTDFSLVSSQRFGIMSGLSYYNALRAGKYFGLGSPNKVRNPFLGEMNLGRTKIYDVSRDYKAERALELTYQLYFIQNNWTLQNQPVDYTIPIEALVEDLHKSNYAVDDILNSRGWWTYTDAKVDRPLLTLPDILSILSGSYIPKFFPVK